VLKVYRHYHYLREHKYNGRKTLNVNVLEDRKAKTIALTTVP